MPQGVRAFQQVTLAYSAGGKASQQLNPGNFYRDIFLRHRGAPTVTAINNTPANTQLGDEHGVLQKIELIANGETIRAGISGNDLFWINYFMYGAPPRITPTIGDSTTANPSYDTSLVLPLKSWRTHTPIDTMLDTINDINNLRLEVSWGNHTNINSAATGFTTAPTLDVSSLESFPRTKSDPQGGFNIMKWFKQTEDVAGANARYNFRLPANGGAYRGFVINSQNAGGTADLATAINKVTLKSGGNVLREYPVSVLRDIIPMQLGFNRNVLTQAGGAGTFFNMRRGTANVFDGWLSLDMLTDQYLGYLTEMQETAGLSDVSLEFDIAAACKLNVICFQVFPPRQAIAAA